MSVWPRLRSWTVAMLRRTRMEREMDEEMRFHIEAHAAHLVSQGVPQQEALRQARLEFGGMALTKEECRDAVGVSFLETLLQDVRHGVRTMLRTPTFAVIAIVVLALGIGANTAIFSVVDAVLLRPLAYRDPGRLVTILMNGEGPVAVANYIDWRDQSHSFAATGAADYWSPNLTGVDSPEHITGLKVTQSLLPMLGVDPMLGRLFVEGEDKEGADREVILSYQLWQRRFSSDRNVLGKPIVLDGNAYVIVGVMPQGFQFAPFWATHAELWVPNAFGARIHSRGGNSLRIFARPERRRFADRSSRGNCGHHGTVGTAVSGHQSQRGSDAAERKSCGTDRNSASGLARRGCVRPADYLCECGSHAFGAGGRASERSCRSGGAGRPARTHHSPVPHRKSLLGGLGA